MTKPGISTNIFAVLNILFWYCMQTQRVKQTTVLAPVIDLKRGGSIDDRQISDMPPHAAAGMKVMIFASEPVSSSVPTWSSWKKICKHVSFLSRHWCGPKDTVPSGFSSSDVLIPLADEYDPVFPNDYEKVMKRHREERQRQREQERQKEIEEREKYAVNMTHEELHISTRINATKLVKLVNVFVLRYQSRTSCLLVSHFKCKFDFLQKKERQAWRRCSQWLLPFSCSRRGLRRRWRLWEGTKKTKWVVLCVFFFLNFHISIFIISVLC